MSYIYDTCTVEKDTWSFSINNSFREHTYYTPRPFNLKVKYNPAVHTKENYTYILGTLNSLYESFINGIIDTYYGADLFGVDGSVGDGIENELLALCDIGASCTLTLPSDLDVLAHNVNCFSYINGRCGYLTTIVYFYYLLNLQHKITFEELTGICNSPMDWGKGYNVTAKHLAIAESNSGDLYLTGKMHQSVNYALSTYTLHRVPLDSLPQLNKVLTHPENTLISPVSDIRKDIKGNVDELLNYPLLYLLFSNSNRTKFNLDEYTPQDIVLLFNYFSTSNFETRRGLIRDYLNKGGSTFTGRLRFNPFDEVK